MKLEVGGKDETALEAEAEVEMEEVYATLPVFCLVYRTQFSYLRLHSEIRWFSRNLSQLKRKSSKIYKGKSFYV